MQICIIWKTTGLLKSMRTRKYDFKISTWWLNVENSICKGKQTQKIQNWWLSSLSLTPLPGLQHLKAGFLQRHPNWFPASGSPSPAQPFPCCQLSSYVQISGSLLCSEDYLHRRARALSFARCPKLTFLVWFLLTLTLSHLCTSNTKLPAITSSDAHSPDAALLLILFLLSITAFPAPCQAPAQLAQLFPRAISP